jgi:hypothetical protein
MSVGALHQDLWGRCIVLDPDTVSVLGGALGPECDHPRTSPVLGSLASFYNFRAEFDKGAQVGREILRLAE